MKPNWTDPRWSNTKPKEPGNYVVRWQKHIHGADGREFRVVITREQKGLRVTCPSMTYDGSYMMRNIKNDLYQWRVAK